jgi:hypothetical protein
MKSLKDIKNEYLSEPRDISFERFLRENFVQVYDKNLNFIGYEQV